MKATNGVILSVLIAFVLTACGAPAQRSKSVRPVATGPGAALADQRDKLTPAQVTALVSDHTGLSYAPGHGTQIEYLGADGSAHLWYPGNKNIVKGQWEVRETDTPDFVRTRICFRYGANIYNPVTKKGGGNWNCTLVPNYFFFEMDRQPGDVFGLADREKVPHSLARDAAKAYTPDRLPSAQPKVVNGMTAIPGLKAKWDASPGM